MPIRMTALARARIRAFVSREGFVGMAISPEQISAVLHSRYLRCKPKRNRRETLVAIRDWKWRMDLDLRSVQLIPVLEYVPVKRVVIATWRLSSARNRKESQPGIDFAQILAILLAHAHKKPTMLEIPLSQLGLNIVPEAQVLTEENPRPKITLGTEAEANYYQAHGKFMTE